MFAQGDRADDHYNRGNALAMAGLLRAAMAAYLEALAREPAHEDALFNHVLVLTLMSRRDQQVQRRPTPKYDAEPVTGGEDEDSREQGSDGELDDPNRSNADASALETAKDGDEGSDEDRLSAGGANSADAAADRDVNPLPGEARARLTSLELEKIEESLEEITEARLGLWRRKIDIEWSSQVRHLPRQSDAW